MKKKENEEVTLYNKFSVWDCYIKDKPCRRVETKSTTINDAKEVISNQLGIKNKDIVGLVGIK